jgi:hypothetical protein
MIDLSTKLQECMALNTGGSFPKSVSNVVIADDVIRVHKETKKRKIVAAPSGSAPPKYQTVYHHGSTNPPRQSQQLQHQRQQQQWAPRPPQRPHQQAAPKALPPPYTCDVPTCTTDRWSRLWPHLLQLWSLRPLCSRVPRVGKECRSGPRHSTAMWSIKGGHYKDRSHQLYHHRGHS